MKKFKEKVAVVTGAASGIGYGLAEHCAKEGMKVVLADIEEDALNQAAEKIEAKGASVLSVVTDVSKLKDVEQLAEKTLDAFSSVDLLFNNAGVAAGGSVWDSTYHDWEWVMGVNLWGVIYGIKTFMPIMLAQNSECHIVNTASVAGLAPGFGLATYSVTKHGVVALTENIYAHLGFNAGKIGASVLCPGYINTRIYDSERNRPSDLMNPDVEIKAEMEQQRQIGRAMIEAGMDPSELAEIVFEGIRKKQLYIQTHDAFNHAIMNRADSIVTGTNPTPGRSKKDIDELLSRRVDLTAEALTKYTGDYTLASNTVTIFAKDGGVWLKSPVTGDSYEIIPTGDHRFELKVNYERYEFIFDGAEVTKCVVFVSGIKSEWEKV